MAGSIRVLVVGVGNMGLSHARAYHSIEGFEIAGLRSRGVLGRDDIKREFPDVPRIPDYYEALEALKPDAVSINTYPDTHERFAKAALNAGCHVFVEKPLAETQEGAESVVAAARATRRKLVVGYTFARASVLAKVHRDRKIPRQAACHADEP
jgi:predicted dehydrogenase